MNKKNLHFCSMYKIVVGILFLILPFQGMGQWKSFQVFKGDTINCEDVKGLKQGVWKKYYRNNTLCSETMFTNNKPSGISRTWYESGKLKAEVFFDKDQIHGKGISYYESGKVLAKGNYFDLKKDSTWVFLWRK
jgi:hypothetical protein